MSLRNPGLGNETPKKQATSTARLCSIDSSLCLPLHSSLSFFFFPWCFLSLFRSFPGHFLRVLDERHPIPLPKPYSGASTIVNGCRVHYIEAQRALCRRRPTFVVVGPAYAALARARHLYCSCKQQIRLGPSEPHGRPLTPLRPRTRARTTADPPRATWCTSLVPGLLLPGAREVGL